MTEALTEAFYRRLHSFHAPTQEFFNKSQPRDKNGMWTVGVQHVASKANAEAIAREGEFFNKNQLRVEDAGIVKHEGSLRVAAEMSSVERRNVEEALDRPVVSHAVFSEMAEFAAQIGTPSGMTLGVAAQITGAAAWESLAGSGSLMPKVYKALDDHEDRVSNGANEHESLGELSKQLTNITGVTQVSGFVSHINTMWAQSSVSYESMLMQIVAATAKNLPNAMTSLKKFGRTAPSMIKDIDTYRKALHAVHEATYRVTQSELADHGITEMTLYRGVGKSGIPRTNGETPESIVAQPNPLSSWSTSKDVALRFSPDGNVFQATIPASQMYSVAARTGAGSWEEREVIVLGNRIDATKVTTSRELSDFAIATDSEVVYIDGDDPDWIKDVEHDFTPGHSASVVTSAGSLLAISPEEFFNKNHSKQNGQFVSLAQAVEHRRIVTDVLKGTVATSEPHLVVLGGGGGSGKSTIVKKLGIGDDHVYISADDIKERLPKYQKLVKAGDHRAAAVVHNESSDVSKQVQDEARNRGLGVVLDQVGSNPRRVSDQIKKFVSAGYKNIDAVYVTVPTHVAVTRANSRAKSTGRAVPEEILRAAHRDVSRGFEEIAALREIRSVKLYDNSGSEPVLVASGGRGNPLAIHNPRLYDEFLKKGHE